MSGIGLGIAIIPQLTKLMIENAGWRIAYIGLGAIIMLFAFVPVVLFVREPPYARAAGNPQDTGPTAREVFTGDWRFWAMSSGFFLAVISTNGTLAHLVALLTDRGISLAHSTAILSSAGISVIFGRIACGWCLDRFYGPYVAIFFLIIPLVGNAALAFGSGGLVSIFGAVFCGVGLGAEVGLIALFASRYFGLRAYGTIYGALFGLFLVANGLGPYLHGLSYDLVRSYEPALIASCGGLLIGALLLGSLGPYSFSVRAPKAEAKQLETGEQFRSRLGAAQPSGTI
jgi:MFS family permease